MMYTTPELYHTRNFLCPVDEAMVDICHTECSQKSPLPCDKDVFNLCLELMLENNWNYPSTAMEAVELYLNLRNEVLRIL